MNTLLARSRQLSPSTPPAEDAFLGLDMIDRDFELVVRQRGCVTWAGADYALGAGHIELAAIRTHLWRSRIELAGVCTYYQGMAVPTFENATPEIALASKINVYGYSPESQVSDRVQIVQSANAIDLSWICHVNKTSENLKDVEIGQIIAGIISAIEKFGDDFIVGVISNFNPVEMSNEAMIAVLRASLPLRARRAEWSKLFLECVEEVKRRDRDPNKLFRGLTVA